MRKPNYRFERAERDRAKKARNDKKLQRQQERAATRADWNRGDCPQSPPGALFHVPSQELPRVLAELSATLRSRGVLFCSNPRGSNKEGMSGDRYSCFFDQVTWHDYVTAAGFFQVRHYYRPPGLPRHKQWWLATVWRKG